MILLTKPKCYGLAAAAGAWALVSLPADCAAQPSNPAPVHSAPASASSKPIKWSSEWTPLFDGETLTHWTNTDFVGHGSVHVQDHQVRIELGEVMTGINWTNGLLPTNNYEISLDAMKIEGSDFFCALTFPVSNSWCSLVVGGWGGGVVGLSSLDGADASENETTRTLYFDTNRWYHVLVQVGTDKIRAWLDKDKVVDVSIAGREVSLRPGPIYLSKPLGVAAYETSAALRDIKLRTIP